MVLITIVSGAYKPTYNCGASHCTLYKYKLIGIIPGMVKVNNSYMKSKWDQLMVDVPSSKHRIWAMVIHPILGINTMGILNPIDGCITIHFYEKTNHVLTRAHMEVSWNRGTPKSSMLSNFNGIFHHKPSIYQFGGTPIYGCLKIP